MKRIINYRPMSVFATFQIIGLLVASYADNFNTCIIMMCFCLATAIAFYFIKFIKRFTYIPIALFIGIFCLSLTINVYQNNCYINYENADISGTISTEINESEKCYYFIIDNVAVNGEKVKGRTIVFTKDLPDERAGQKIKFKSNIKSEEFDIHDSFFLANYRKGIYYSAFAKNIEYIGEGDLSLDTRICYKLKKILYENTKESTANISTALLIGDKSNINDTFYNNIVASGLAHIFAVSGLHVGIVSMFLMLIFKKSKLKLWFKNLIISCFLLLYGALCGFPASVIRATIMIIVYLFANCFGKKLDSLSTLALSSILILLIYPTDFFSLGFPLSFMAVLGIIFLEPIFARKFNKLPKWMNGLLSVSLAVNIMLFPLLVYFFGKVQTLFLITNLIVLPLLPFIFAIIFVLSTMVMIIPIFAPILRVLDFVVLPITLTSTTIGSLVISEININFQLAFALIYYLIIVLSSRFLFFEKETKIKLGLSLSAVIFTFCMAFI